MTSELIEHIDRLSSDDEIAITMNPSDFYALFNLLKTQPETERLCQRLGDSAEVITLDWLDKKRAEFP